jgi:PAS domain S-box-containing protein
MRTPAPQAPRESPHAKLRAREERLLCSLDAANVGTWEWSIATGEVRWSDNLERIHGQPPGAFKCTFEGFLEGVHPDDRPRVLSTIQRAIGSGEEYAIEYRSLRADGTAMWLEGRGRVFYDDQGQPAWMSGICMDVTERRQLQEQLRQTQRLESVGLLAGGVAHDFNNLLTGILGNASLAAAGLEPTNRVQAYLEDVISASRRAARLTQQLLAYAGKGRVVSEHLDLSKLVEDLVPLVRPSMPAGVQLALDLAPAPIEADAGQIHQIVMNLVINASEAIDGTGTVELKTSVETADARACHGLAPGRYACLTVRDTGCGMDEATLARIFEPFFSTKFTGRGLGLAAALGIVHAHQGAITVESAPGRGTTFTVWLPACGATPAEPKQPAVSSSDLSGSGIILVVDDEQLVLRMAHASLEAYGYTALLASDGQSALDLFAACGGRIRAVILDLTMPGMTGEETLHHLRAAQPAMPVILASGYDGGEITERFGGQISGFLQKPYTAEQLAQRIRAALT